MSFILNNSVLHKLLTHYTLIKLVYAFTTQAKLQVIILVNSGNLWTGYNGDACITKVGGRRGVSFILNNSVLHKLLTHYTLIKLVYAFTTKAKQQVIILVNSGNLWTGYNGDACITKVGGRRGVSFILNNSVLHKLTHYTLIK